MSETAPRASLAARIAATPLAWDRARADSAMADLREKLAGTDDPALTLLDDPQVGRLVAGVLGCSPYLAAAILRAPRRLLRLLSTAPEDRMAELAAALPGAMGACTAVPDAMRVLRDYKSEAALLIALADVAGIWPVMRVTAALTEVADQALGHAVRFLLGRAARAGDFLPADPEHPESSSGYIVLAMGKYGAGELNYSSDIDLIVFYDRERTRLKPEVEVQSFFVRMTRDLVRLMQDRTAEGYVFRTDLRLRPDPGATQVALSTQAAMHYYEAFGQNWERAALIKARPSAGDIEAGRILLAELAPYIWRKYLDFAAIADIHAMKRQIHAFRGFGELAVAGHNIKLGRGGIREIEFFAQTQQLIAGGRQTDLRTGETLTALERLARREWISDKARDELSEAYTFLRMVEHRLQMIADEQTQTLPTDPAKLEQLALFAGFPNFEAFSTALHARLERVQRHYARLFEDSPDLAAAQGSLVFTGDEDDPATLETLKRMGYRDPSAAIATVKGWHFGRYPAMRSARARELLTEFQPVLLEALAATPEPNRTLAGFDRFLSELPAGVQLFSLLRSNPSLLRLIADIMGSAPRLAQILSRRSRMLDAVLDPGFFGSEPTEERLRQRIAAELGTARDYQDRLDRARIIGNEQSFLIGVRVLSGTISADRAGGAYAQLAESLIAEMQAAVEAEMARQYGRLAGGAASVVAMGKLGGREMAANSDLDLIVVYDHDPAATQSDGARPLPALQYYARFTQRLISALSSPTGEGRLYEVDMRLRPSGTSGPVASHITSFTDYQATAAWTWEHLALTRARVLTGPPALRQRIEAVIREALMRKRDPAALARDVREMRTRIAAEKGTGDLWDLKQIRGGLVDIEFMAQYLQLAHAWQRPQVLSTNTLTALQRLAGEGLLAVEHADILIPGLRLIQSLTQVLRLCIDGRFDPESAPSGLKTQLARAGEMPDFAGLEALLAERLAQSAALFETVVAEPPGGSDGFGPPGR